MTRVVGGRYELIRLLGQGGMGAVWEARHLTTRGRCAVKLLHPDVARDEEMAVRFQREARAPAQIGHPGIVDITDGGVEEDGTPFLVMELLQGESLRDRFARPGVDRLERLRLVERALEPLAAAHASGFVHRDLKPENIFVAHSHEGEVVKLLDFGLARDQSAESITRTGVAMGTVLYMSPEQFRSTRSATAAADVWAMGVMLYEAVTGDVPFTGSTPSEVLIRACTEPHPPLTEACPDVAPALVRLVDACLAKEPADRPADAATLGRQLRAVVANSAEGGAPVARPAQDAPAPHAPTVALPPERLPSPSRVQAARKPPARTAPLQDDVARAVQPSDRSPPARPGGWGLRLGLIAGGALLALGGAVAGVLALAVNEDPPDGVPLRAQLEWVETGRHFHRLRVRTTPQARIRVAGRDAVAGSDGVALVDVGDAAIGADDRVTVTVTLDGSSRTEHIPAPPLDLAREVRLRWSGTSEAAIHARSALAEEPVSLGFVPGGTEVALELEVPRFTTARMGHAEAAADEAELLTLRVPLIDLAGEVPIGALRSSLDRGPRPTGEVEVSRRLVLSRRGQSASVDVTFRLLPARIGSQLQQAFRAVREGGLPLPGETTEAVEARLIVAPGFPGGIFGREGTVADVDHVALIDEVVDRRDPYACNVRWGLFEARTGRLTESRTFEDTGCNEQQGSRPVRDWIEDLATGR